jgi:outer membrane protein assembly factor BamB
VRVKLSKLITGKKLSLIFLLILSLFIIILPGCSGGAVTRGWSGIISTNEALYVGGMDGKIYAVNPLNGTIIWSTELEPLPSGGWFSPASFAALYSTPAAAGNMVFAGSYLLTGSAERGRIFGLNAETGAIVWTYPARGALDATIIGSIAAADGVVYAGATDHKIYALNAATGEKKWEFTTGDQVWAGPVVSGGVVYAGSFDKKLYALDAATGAEKWHYETDGAIAAPALVFNNVVYVGSYNRHFYAMDATTGMVKWDFIAGNGFWATPVIAANTLYIPCLDGKVYVVEVGTGRDLGTANLSSYLSSSPAAVGDSVVFATPEGSLFLLSPGNINAPTFNDLKSTVFAPLASANDTVYIHTWAPERLYALDTTGKQKWNPLDLQKK